MDAYALTSGRRIADALVAVGLLAACSGSDDAVMLRGIPLPEVSDPAVASEFRLEYVQSIGDEGGPLSFSQIGAVAVSENGMMAVLDRHPCQVVLYSLTEEAFVRRIGGCGDGPGEFRRPSAVILVGDTIIIYDPAAGRVQYLTLAGEELRRAEFTDVGHRVADVALLDDSLLVLALTAPPAQFAPAWMGDDQPLLEVVRRDGWEPVSDAVQLPLVAVRNQFNLGTFVGLCTAKVEQRSLVAVSNPWAFEGATMEGPALSPRNHFLTRVPWSTPRPYAAVEGSVRPGAVAADVVCTGVGPLWWQLRYDWDATPPLPIGGRFELRRWDGTLAMALDFHSTDSLWFGRPVAAVGSRLFFRGNNNVDFPQIVEFTVQRVRDDLPTSPP